MKVLASQCLGPVAKPSDTRSNRLMVQCLGRAMWWYLRDYTQDYIWWFWVYVGLTPGLKLRSLFLSVICP